jgi:hypothetical protein
MTVAAVGRGGDNGDDGEPTASDAGPVDIVRATVASPAFVAPATPGYVEDIVITAANGYHLIHFVVTAFDARLVLYVWLDRLNGNLAMTQRSLRGIGQNLVAA